jgi:predicted CXXCH cytochrome family protein
VHGGSVNRFANHTSASDLANIATVRADSCAGCHDTHGTTNNHNIRTTINGLTVTYVGATPSFFDQTPDGNGLYHGLCQVCHTRTKYYNRNTAPAAHNATANCLSCHSHKPAKAPFFAFAPFGDCNTCHGYPPVSNMTGLGIHANYSTAKLQDYSGGGGAHSVAGHIPRTAIATAGASLCTACHNIDYNTSHNQGGTPAKKSFVKVVVDPKYKFNNATSITYKANSCSNVSCHFKPTPNWVTGN